MKELGSVREPRVRPTLAEAGIDKKLAPPAASLPGDTGVAR